MTPRKGHEKEKIIIIILKKKKKEKKEKPIAPPGLRKFA